MGSGSGQKTGDEKNMPLKDRGPQRRFIRDAVDARWNLGEILLPIAVVLIVVQFAFAKSVLGVLAVYVLYLYMVVFAIDTALLWRSVKKRLRSMAVQERKAKTRLERLDAELRSFSPTIPQPEGAP